MEIVLIHCVSIIGHRLEYLHHLYMGAVNNEGRKYYFAVPEVFKEVSHYYEWPACNRISFIYIKDVKASSGRLRLLKNSYNKCKSLYAFLRKTEANRVLLIDFMSYLPFLPLFMRKHVKVTGIIYRIYLFEWKEESILTKIRDVTVFLIISKCKAFDNIFILNDMSCAECLNRIYKTLKFKYLPDPIASLDVSNTINIREEYAIARGIKVVLHPGGMLPYKGTLEILKAIALMDDIACSKYVFVFVGRITSSIREEFFKLEKEVGDKARIILEEGFLSLDRLGAWFEAADIILIPYRSKAQSSGVIGHSAYYNKPVVVAKEGLIGKIVKKYKLGYLLERPDAVSIRKFLERDVNCTCHGSKAYVNDHTVTAFNYHIGI